MIDVIAVRGAGDQGNAVVRVSEALAGCLGTHTCPGSSEHAEEWPANAVAVVGRSDPDAPWLHLARSVRQPIVVAGDHVVGRDAAVAPAADAEARGIGNPLLDRFVNGADQIERYGRNVTRPSRRRRCSVRLTVTWVTPRRLARSITRASPMVSINSATIST